MSFKMTVINIRTGRTIDCEDLLMEYAKLELSGGFEDIGMQGDGTPVVFDKCGNFGYLDANEFEIAIQFDGLANIGV